MLCADMQVNYKQEFALGDKSLHEHRIEESENVLRMDFCSLKTAVVKSTKISHQSKVLTHQ